MRERTQKKFFFYCGRRFFFGGRTHWMIGRNSEDFWEWRIEETEKEQLQPRLSRYAFRYSWNFYPCSIFQRVCFWIFIVLLILCGRKRPQIVLVDIGCLFVCLKPVVIFPTSLSPSKNHEMWLYRLPSIFIIFILWCLLVLSSFSLFWIIPPSFLVIVY